MSIRHPIAMLALSLFLAPATASADPATVHHTTTCMVGTLGIDAGGDVVFIAFRGRGSHVFTDDDFDRGSFHCKADIPLGEVADGYDPFTFAPITAYVLSFDEVCGALGDDACHGGVLRVDSSAVGGFPIYVDGVPTTDWIERITERGDGLLTAWYGR
jgi:hypothetical protein